MLDPKIVINITRQIHRQFPEVAASQPTVRAQSASKSARGGQAGASSANREPFSEVIATHYLLTFRGNVGVDTLVKDVILPRWVRVVVNVNGKILKITTSR